MKDLCLHIKNIKNISEGKLVIPLNNQIHCLVGENGSGKSTIMSCLAQMIFRKSLDYFHAEDLSADSYIQYTYGDEYNTWMYDAKQSRMICSDENAHIKFNGMYEGSLFYGTRFCDSLTIDDLVKTQRINDNDIVDSDKYIQEELSYIIHGDKTHYQHLKRVRNRAITKRLNLRNTPYFHEFSNGLVSQYRMSSGECLLISLLHFIYNAIERRSLPTDQPILMLIDEIELALHPIAVSRLMDLLDETIEKHNNLTIILSSHSPELIRKVKPQNLFMIEPKDSDIHKFDVINPCYPSYAIRDVYMHTGFDYVILVEDYLAKYVVEKIIDKLDLRKSCLINVLPVGGWENVLKLQGRIYNDNLLGNSTKICSVLDGDVSSLPKNEYKAYPKTFLPINSIEKFLLKVLVKNVDYGIKKDINDAFFFVESLDEILADYHKNIKNDKAGKKLYHMLREKLEKRQISEEAFIKGLCDILLKHLNFTQFETALKGLIS